MRILGGNIKGKELHAPKGPHVRPPLARIRQIIFSILGERTDGANVLDLFAGTGSLGLEALSRGAVHVIFVDNSARSMRALRSNMERCGAGEHALAMMLSTFQVFKSRKIRQAAPYDIIFADPPYPLLDMPRGLSRFMRLLDRLVEEDLLADGGVIMARHRPGILLAENLQNLEITHSRKAGDTEATFMKRTG